MKVLSDGWRRWIGSASVGLFLLLGVILLGLVPGGGSAPFGLKTNGITETNISLVITNGQSTNYYAIYVYDFLGETNQYVSIVPGSIGQTNFTILKEGRMMRFFKAAVDQDWDHDGILNIHDADEWDPSVGALTITI